MIVGDLKIKNIGLWLSDFLLNHKTLGEVYANAEYMPMFPINKLPGNSLHTPHQITIGFHQEYNIVNFF